ncbi:MAG: glycosyltransferase [Chloroflexi bacterium]|nr:MAG: glycosyltransferase [Chloroflexota bacterium]
MSPRRVVHLLPGLGVGGSERLVLELCNGLDRRRFEQHVVLSRATAVTPWWPPELELRVPLHLARGRVPETLAGLAPALVHAPWWGVDDPALRALVASGGDLPVVLSATDGHEPLRGPAIRVTVFCCAAQRDAVDGPPSPSTVIHNGISPPVPITAGERAAARRRLALAGGDEVVVVMARIHHDKVNAAGFDAVATLLRERPAATALVLGSGDRLAAWRRRAAASGAAPRVRFCGLVPRPRPQLAAADLLLHPVRRDTFPYAVLEALGCGLPVVALDLGGLREMCGDAAVLAGSPVAAGHQAAALLDDPARRASLGAAGRRRAERFGAAATAAAYAEVFDSVLATSRP